MPIFFFNVAEGSEYYSDTEGVEHPDLARAEKEAFAGASGRIADAVNSG